VTAIKALLRDRRRSQRGSVLSATLIMVAFLAIISGALMTELSTHFLISRALVNRVANEATVNSAMELALDKFQNTALQSGCPGAPLPITLNGRTAVVSYASCWPSVRESPQFSSIANPGPFAVEGDHAILPGQDTYLVGDSSGNVYQYKFGGAQTWSMNLGSSITGPLLAMADISGDATDISNLVPIAGGNLVCSTTCVELLQQDTNRVGPDLFCPMSTRAPVTSRPAAGLAFPNLTYFGDGGGTLYAYVASETNRCVLQESISTGNAAIVAGPIVFQNGSRDEVYIVTSSGATSHLLRYTYDPGDSPAWNPSDSVPLPFANPVGATVDQNSAPPARIAVTFAGGGVAIVNVPNNYDPSLGSTKGLGTGIAAAPSWCACPGPQIGVAGLNGTLYVLDSGLNVVTSYASGSPIHTTPTSDGVGEWFFGADNGLLYEVQQSGPSALVQRATYGPFGPVTSSVQVAPCSGKICLYLGSSNNEYAISLDSRRAVMTACLSNAMGACTGENPRLSAQVEIGEITSQQTVHVQGWSYTSP
jgi:hypothetical protein